MAGIDSEIIKELALFAAKNSSEGNVGATTKKLLCDFYEAVAIIKEYDKQVKKQSKSEKSEVAKSSKKKQSEKATKIDKNSKKEDKRDKKLIKRKKQSDKAAKKQNESAESIGSKSKNFTEMI